MKFGVCTDFSSGPVLAKAGFDFIELVVQSHLKPQEPEDNFRPVLEQIKACPVRCSAANCFVPGSLKICGPDASLEKLEAYVSVAFERAKRAGIKTIVFGSGGARQIPDGVDRGSAWKQIVEFGKMIGPLAQKNGVTIAVEPLNRKECNVLNSVGEGARYVREVNHPAVRLLADSYHWGLDSDSFDDLVAAGPLLSHVHVATFPSRVAPGFDGCDLAPFFHALREGGYEGAVSIESSWRDMPAQAKKALDTLKALDAVK
jgi:sugar phosphate isomerase/epimerase